MNSANLSSESPWRARRNNRWLELGSTECKNSSNEVGARARASTGAGKDVDAGVGIVGRVATTRGWLLHLQFTKECLYETTRLMRTSAPHPSS